MSAALSAFYRRTILIAEARLRKQATRDPLTGPANRSHFDAQATEALERSQRYGRTPPRRRGPRRCMPPSMRGATRCS